jgi:uncharacterized protein (DUF1499 family)
MSPEQTHTVAAARWSCRLALFSVSLILVTLALHRLAAVSTPLALNLWAVGLAGAGLAFLIGLVALARIWLTGHAGAGAMAVGLLLPLLVFAGPVGYLLAHLELPWINDVATDTTSPPAFAALAKRPAGANPSAYPGRPFADLQAKAFPDLRPLVLDRPVEEAYELVEEAVRRLRWRVIAEEPLTGERGAKAGRIEAVDHTLLVGFADDIVIRIVGGSSRARIDARSASRYGRFDFGQNAARLRRFLAEVRTRAEFTPPAAAIAGKGLQKKRGTGTARTLIKRRKARDQRKAEGRTVRGPAKSGAPRAPAPKATQP